MRAHRLTAPGTLQATEVPYPRASDVNDGEVLLRVRASSICGSDIPHFRRGDEAGGPPRAGYPLHELVGDVITSRSEGLYPGDRVVGWASKSDGLADQVVTDGAGLTPTIKGMPPWQAVIAQPLACVLYAVDRLRPVENLDVAVLGLGPIGLLFCHVLSSLGAASVTGVDPVDRSDVAADFGITHLVNATSQQWTSSLLPSRRPKILIEAVGHQTGTLGDALQAADFGATVYAFGIPQTTDYPVNVPALVRKNLTLIGGITMDRRRSLTRAVRHLQFHPALPSSLVTHVLPVSKAQEAFELAGQPRTGRLKVVLADTDTSGGDLA